MVKPSFLNRIAELLKNDLTQVHVGTGSPWL